MDDVTYLWDHALQHDEINEVWKEINELKKKLACTTQEVERLKSERNKEIQNNKELCIVLKCALQQRDEARNQLHQLINNITFSPNTTLNVLRQDSDVSDPTDPIMDTLLKGRVLPRNGMFLRSVLQAGQLLAAVPLLTWRNPPELQAFPVPVGGGEPEPLLAPHLVVKEEKNNSLSYADFGYGRINGH